MQEERLRELKMSKHERDFYERYVIGQDLKGLLRLVLEEEQSADYDNGLSAMTVSLIERALSFAEEQALSAAPRQEDYSKNAVLNAAAPAPSQLTEEQRVEIWFDEAPSQGSNRGFIRTLASPAEGRKS